MTSIAWVNAAICAGIFVIVSCRLPKQGENTRPSVIVSYLLMLLASVASGAAWLMWREEVGIGHIFLSSAMLAHLLAGTKSWRSGQPSTVQKHVWRERRGDRRRDSRRAM